MAINISHIILTKPHNIKYLFPAFKRINEERKNKGLSSISPSTNAVEFAGQIKGWVIVPYVKDLEGKGGRSQPGLRLVLYDPNGVRKAAPIYYGESGSKTGIVQSKVARLFKHLK